MAALRSIRAARPDGARIYVILDNLSAHKGDTIRRWAKRTGSRCASRPPTHPGPTRSRLTSGRSDSSRPPTPTTATTPHGPGPFTPIPAGATPMRFSRSRSTLGQPASRKPPVGGARATRSVETTTYSPAPATECRRRGCTMTHTRFPTRWPSTPAPVAATVPAKSSPTPIGRRARRAASRADTDRQLIDSHGSGRCPGPA